LTFEERAAAQKPPSGFTPITGVDGFIADNGPVFARREDNGAVTFGCRIMPHMCNPMGGAHGGWIATLFDVALPLTGRLTDPQLGDRFIMTVSLSIDYLQSPRLGDWTELGGRVLKRTERMVFVEGLMRAGDDVIARGSGVFRIGPQAPPLGF